MNYLHVAPRAGAWIEIDNCMRKGVLAWVAPRAGAWIEIGNGRHDP